MPHIETEGNPEQIDMLLAAVRGGGNDLVVYQWGAEVFDSNRIPTIHRHFCASHFSEKEVADLQETERLFYHAALARRV